MEKKNTYTNFFNDDSQAVYREKLSDIMTKQAISKQEVADKIGISVITLRAFIMRGEKVRPITFTRIVAFVNECNLCIKE